MQPLDRTAALVARIRSDSASLANLVPLLDDAASSPARRATPKTKDGGPHDLGIRSKGVHSDPTGETATDLRRLALKREVRTAERLLLRASAEVMGARAALERALDAWEGLDA